MAETHNTPLLWHGSGTGENDSVLRTVLLQGLRGSHANTTKNYQAKGVFFCTSRNWCAAYAQRLVNPQHGYHRAGKPFIAAAGFDAALDWDIDYELSYRAALDYLKLFKSELPKFPAGQLRVKVAKAHVANRYPGATAEQLQETLADWTMHKLEISAHGPELHFDSNTDARRLHIGINWHTGEVKNAHVYSSTFANVLEQLAHFYRARRPEQFRDYVAGRVQNTPMNGAGAYHPCGFALKYTGAAPLKVLAAEVRDANRWKPALLRSETGHPAALN